MKSASAVLDAVATYYGVSRAEVEQEITDAIRQAMQHPDPRVRQRWKDLWPNGTEPSPAEFLTTLALLFTQNDTAFPT